VVTPGQRRAVITHAKRTAAISERRACRFLGVHRSLVRYQSCRPPETELRARLKILAEQHPSWGSPRLTWLLRREGRVVNHKKVERLYREEGLTVKRRRRKRVARPRVEMPTPRRANEQWSMDFMRDQLAGGRVFRLLTVVDHYTRESPVIEVDLSLPGGRVAQVLDRVAGHRGLPRSIRVDNGPEFTGRALDEWAHLRSVKLEFIRPGKPVENAFIESFNGRLRQECLNQHWFLDLEDARRTIEAWRISYNTNRPHSGLGGQTPAEFARMKKRENQTRLSA
jgi:putative transposase